MALIIIILLFWIGYAWYKAGLMKNDVLSHWHHPFDTPPFAPTDFYKGVTDALQVKAMKHIGNETITYSQGGLLSPNRLYLRITYKELVFDICAAPFGTGYFVSWWMGETGDPIRDLLRNLPVIGKVFNKREKTFFELDTAIMFKETVKKCVRETIEQLTENKGLRQLADAEWQEYNRLY